jgi:hypothetical protein
MSDERRETEASRRALPAVAVGSQPAVRGATIYHNLVPSPNTYSRPVFDAHRCVAAMFAAAQRLPAVAVAGTGHLIG